MILFLVTSVLPLVALAVVVGLRVPLGLLALYAAIVPFGSGIRVPVGLPSPFNTLSTFAGLAATLGLVVHLAVSRARARELDAPVPVWILFIGWAALSFLWSINRGGTVDGVVVLLSLVGLYAVVAFTRVRPRDLARFEAAVVLGGAVTGAIALWQLTTGTLPGSGTGVPRFVAAGGGGEAGDPNITAAALLLPVAIGLGRGLQKRAAPSAAAYLAGASLSVAAVLLAVSRGGLIGLLVVMLVLAVNERRVRVRAAYVGLPVMALMVALALAPAGLTARAASVSSTGRTDIWRVGLAACPRYCLAGSGWGTFPDVHEEALLANPGAKGNRLRYEAHSMWLQALVETGVVGFVLLVLGLALVARQALILPPGTRGPPLAGLAGLVVTNTLLSNVEFKYFWLVLIYATLVWQSASAGDDEDVRHVTPADPRLLPYTDHGKVHAGNPR